MSKFDVVYSGGTIVTENAVFSGSLAVKEGKVARIVEGDELLPAEETVDISGKHLLPGLIDCHQHLNEPGREHWEGYTPGSFASAAGGITTLMEMPFNSLPPTRNVGLLEEKQQAVKDKSLIDYALWALVENTNLDELKSLHKSGAIAFKGFMLDPGTEFNQINSFDLLKAMEIISKTGSLIGLHAEDQRLVEGFTERIKSKGRKDARAWAESRPPVVELEALQQAVLLARQTNCRLHMVHTTLADGFDIINDAKNRGAPVTGETCPHYLALDEDDLARIGPAAKCSPVLRKRREVERLWGEVLSGRVDLISSDHSPCPVDMKESGNDDIWKAWGGMNSSQMMLPVILTEGVHKRGLSLTSMARLLTANPARLFGIYPKKGKLAPGADADLAIVDLNEEWVLENEMLFSHHKISPYVGMRFKGRVHQTVVRGRTVYRDGTITANPGYGLLLKPNYKKREHNNFAGL